jgi:hypothetical protein
LAAAGRASAASGEIAVAVAVAVAVALRATGATGTCCSDGCGMRTGAAAGVISSSQLSMIVFLDPELRIEFVCDPGVELIVRFRAAPVCLLAHLPAHLSAHFAAHLLSWVARWSGRR